MLRFTIADIRFVVRLRSRSEPPLKQFHVKAKKAFLQKRAYYSGANARRRRTRKWTSKTFPRAGPMDSPCAFSPSSATLYECILTECCRRCALIHCHRPDLLDYDKLDKVRCAADLPFHGSYHPVTGRSTREHPPCTSSSGRAPRDPSTPVQRLACRVQLTVAVATPRS